VENTAVTRVSSAGVYPFLITAPQGPISIIDRRMDKVTRGVQILVSASGATPAHYSVDSCWFNTYTVGPWTRPQGSAITQR